jgi:predicted RNase H-like HicB family nuclease
MPEVVKWEYLTVDRKGRPPLYDAELNKLGEEGWELVTAYDSVFRFKRPIPKPAIVLTSKPPVRAIRVYYFLHYDAVERISSAIPLSFDSIVGVSGSGRTPEEAVENLKSAVQHLMLQYVHVDNLPFNAYKPRPGDSSVVVSFPENYPS